jgi:hypothetical protein
MQMSKVPIIFGYAYSCKLGVSQKNAACVSFCELEHDTLNQAELNEIKIIENN